MNSFAVKQAERDLRRAQAIALYPDVWARIIDEWRSPGLDDRAWLMYSASYLMRTGNVRWALDPVWLRQWLADASKMNVGHDLRALAFVLLTHEHDDHLDLGLIRQLRDLPIRWVVPQAILSLVRQTGLSSEKIIVPQVLVPLELEGITILPFEGLHWAETATGGHESASGRRGVPATGYLVEFSGKRWLFPGDVRTYNASALPSRERIYGLFAHLWLGRASALLDPPPLLESFCRFCIETGTQRVVLTHLEEFGRDVNDLWDASHVRQVLSRFREIAPGLSVAPAFMGERVTL